MSRALRLIAEGSLDGVVVADLAQRLGVGERHLRRLFERHVGASPRQVAMTERVRLAKRLIDETSLPLGAVALHAGFGSVRRFHAAVRKVYRMPPRDLRRGGVAAVGELVVRLPYRPPLAWTTLLEFLGRRAIPEVESVVEAVYRRTITVGAARGWLEVSEAAGNTLAARIVLDRSASLLPILARISRLFDLAVDPAPVAGHLGRDPALSAGVRAVPGVRLPGAWDGFELGVRAVLGQQVSVAGATTLAGRLVERFGEPLGDAPPPLARLFPSPRVLAEADVASVGLPRARGETIRELARRVASGDLVLDGSRDPARCRHELMAVPGIGAWTADYVAMRALADPDAFPDGDLVIRKVLGGAVPLTAIEARARAERWRPWRAYAAMYVWLSAK